MEIKQLEEKLVTINKLYKQLSTNTNLDIIKRNLKARLFKEFLGVGTFYVDNTGIYAQIGDSYMDIINMEFVNIRPNMKEGYSGVITDFPIPKSMEQRMS